MKYYLYFILILSFVLSGCKASDKTETNFFIEKNFKIFLDDDREIILNAINNINIAPPSLNEAIFDKVYIKIMTTKSLLEEDRNNWVDGLNRQSIDYVDLDTLCWATNYIKAYSDIIDEKNKTKINQSTRNNINLLYSFKEDIINLRDSKDDSLKYRLLLCK